MAYQAPNEGPDDETGRLDPGALSVADTARVLSRIGGGEITEEMLRADINDGAPTNPDGSLNIVLYAAWLLKEDGASGRSHGED